MRKNVIFTEVDCDRNRIIFMYKGVNNTCQLFYSKYRKSVHEYFRYGRSMKQLYNERTWLSNIFLRKIVEDRLKSAVKNVERKRMNAG